MAESTPTSDALREELATLRSQMENLLKTVENKKSEIAGDAIDRMSRELEYYRKKAADGATHLREVGEAGLDTVGEQVRRNPLMSLLVAFGAGCFIATLFRGMR